MWETLNHLLLAYLIPANLFSASISNTPPPLALKVEPLAVIKEKAPLPHIIAKAGLIIETHSNEALFSKGSFDPLPIASLTKLMTALVVRERLTLDQVVTVSERVKKIGGSRMGLFPGEKIKVRELLKGLLVASGNDAALSLSEAVAGSPEAFTILMNEKRKDLGLHETFFVDPAGIDDQNISTVFELAHLAKQVFKDGFLQSVMREKEITVFSVNKGAQHQLTNTNRLLGTDISGRIIAGKTGTTPVAGQCLIAFFETVGDRTTMVILLGSNNRYEEVKKLISWVDKTFTWYHEDRAPY